MSSKRGDETINLKAILIGYLLHWKLFVGAFLVSLIPAILYLVYYPTTYEIMSCFKVQDDNSLSSGSTTLGDAAGLMKSFGLNGASNMGIVIDDELAIVKSHDLWKSVVINLGLNAEYVEPLTWNYKMYRDLPYLMVADSATLQSQESTIEFYVKEDATGKVKVRGKTKTDKQYYEFASLPAVVTFGNNRFVLSHGPGYVQGKKTKLYITMRPPGFAGDDLVKKVRVETYSNFSNVIEFTMRDPEKERGIKVLNTVMALYNHRADSINSKDAFSTVQFLDGRINKVIMDLVKAEQAIEQYKTINQVTDLDADLLFYVDQMKDLQAKIIDLESQGYAIKFMEDFVNDPVHKYDLVPLLMNVQEGEKSGSISSYNSLLLERQRMLQNSKEDNPLFSVMDKQLNQLREGVILTIRNAHESLNMTLNDLRSKEKTLIDKMSAVPSKEREYVGFKRDQEVAQGVYLVLLQMREEALLKMNKGTNRVQIVDAAYAGSVPVAPRKLYAAIAIFLFTIAVPVVYLFCKEQLIGLKAEYDKIEKKSV